MRSKKFALIMAAVIGVTSVPVNNLTGYAEETAEEELLWTEELNKAELDSDEAEDRDTTFSEQYENSELTVQQEDENEDELLIEEELPETQEAYTEETEVSETERASETETEIAEENLIEEVENDAEETVEMEASAPDMIPLNETYFPDAQFRAVLEDYDLDEDGYLSLEERNNVDELYIDGLEIDNLSGIEYFEYLEYLDCSDNFLGELDVSQNKNLGVLYCHDNYLDDLDVSENEALIFLNCSNNFLVSLDVSNNGELYSLKCYSNSLRTLKLGDNKILETLYCNNNLLTNIDVSQNSRLCYFDCSYNYLTTLDISSIEYLEELDCSHNRLTGFDLSQSDVEIVDFSGNRTRILPELLTYADGSWRLDLSSIMPAEYMERVTSVKCVTHDVELQNGAIMFNGSQRPSEFWYEFDLQSPCIDEMMEVHVVVSDNDDNDYYDDNDDDHDNDEKLQLEYSRDIYVKPGEAAVLSVKVTTEGATGLTYHWYEADDEGNETIIAETTGSSCTVRSPRTDIFYKCKVTDDEENYGIASFYIHTNHFNVFPTSAHTFTEVLPGGDVALTAYVMADDKEGIRYQWYRYDPDVLNKYGYYGEYITIPNATASQYVLKNITRNGGYYCEVSDKYGNNSRAEYYVRVQNHLQIAYDETVYVSEGQDVKLSVKVTADNTNGLKYSWHDALEDEDVDADTKELLVENVTTPKEFYCEVTDIYGNSEFAIIKVRNVDRPCLINTWEEVYIAPGEDAVLELKFDNGKIPENVDYDWDIEEGDLEYGEDGHICIVKNLEKSRNYYTCLCQVMYGGYSEEMRFYIWVNENHLSCTSDDEKMRADGYAKVEKQMQLDWVLSADGKYPPLSVLVSADDMSQLKYQWYKYDWYTQSYQIIEGATGLTCTPDSTSSTIENRYYFEATDQYGNKAFYDFFIVTLSDVAGEHEHKWQSKVTKSPTCTLAGVKTYTCTECKETRTETIAPKGHSYGAWKTVSAATVFAAEVQERTCSACGQTEKRSVGTKLKPTATVNVTTIPMKLKQSTTKVTVSGLANGDSVKSWKSSNTKIVKVDNKGTITAQGKTGKATLTVTLASGLTKKISVNVQKKTVATTKLNGLPSKVTVEKGKKLTLTPVVTPITSQNKVTYKSSNKKVATVSSSGVITAKKAGTAKITVTSGKKKVTVKVTVPKTATKEIKNVPKTLTIKKGKSYTLKAKLAPSNSEEKITYTSSNKKVATVSAKGKITAKKKGKTVITVKSGKISVKCTVTVK